MDGDELCVWWLLLRHQQQKRLLSLQRRVHARQVEVVTKRLLRARHYIITACLKTPRSSAWAKFYRDASDENFINVMSLPRYGDYLVACRL